MSRPDLEGIDEFRKELASEYISVVKGRPGAAGGLTHLYVEILSQLSLSHVVQLLLDGIAYDLIKQGSDAFVLRPFLNAYKKLQERNKKRYLIDVSELRIEFQDTIIIINNISPDGILPHLQKIFSVLAEQYSDLVVNDETPFAIYIPVFEDPDPERACRFRIIGDIDETIRSHGPEDYVRFWGLEYDYAGKIRVYDVVNRQIIDDPFHTLEQYWNEMSKRWRAKMKDGGES